jgi:hypothetical protein
MLEPPAGPRQNPDPRGLHLLIDCFVASLGADEVRVRRLSRGPGSPEEETDTGRRAVAELRRDAHAFESV